MKYRLLIIGLIWVASSTEAQYFYNAPPYEYELIGKGGRAAGMGYAYSGVADDATAIYWNPAGIAQINRAEVAIVNRVTFTDELYTAWPSRQYKPKYVLDYFGLVIPFTLREKTFSMGVSYQNKINYKEQYTSYSINGEPEEFLFNHITINSVSGCIAHALSPFLYLGASFDTWFSIGSKEEYSFFVRDRYFEGISDSPLDKQYFQVTEKYYRGLSMAVGLLMDFSNFGVPYRLSLKYESPKFIRSQYKEVQFARYYYDYPEDEDANEPEPDFDYIGKYLGTRLFYIHNIITLGMSYRLGDYFTLACDLDYKPFSRSNCTFEGTIYSNHPGYEIDIDQTFSYYITEAACNMHQVRFGAEYIINLDQGLIPIRAGWKWGPTSLMHYTRNPDPTPDPGKEYLRDKLVYVNSFTTGAGVVLNRYSIDLAYEYYGYKRTDISGFLEIGRYHFLVVSAIYNF